MPVVELFRTEYVGAGGAQIERKKRRVRTCHKCGCVKKHVLAEAEVRRKDKSSEECPGIGVSYVEWTDIGPVPVDLDIQAK